MILAFDTSTALTSAALVDGSRVVAERAELDSRRHAEVQAPLLRQVLADAGGDISSVTAIACGVGPGPYTGLRVGIATARALGLAWGLPVIGVCSLDAIAEAAIDAGVPGAFAVAADARRREVYWATYDSRGDRVDGPLVTRPADIPAAARELAWCGQGATAHAETLGPSTVAGAVASSSLLYPHAAWLGRRVARLLAAGVTVTPATPTLAAHGDEGAGTAEALAGAALLPPEPLYLRRPDITMAGA